MTRVNNRVSWVDAENSRLCVVDKLCEIFRRIRFSDSAGEDAVADKEVVGDGAVVKRACCLGGQCETEPALGVSAQDECGQFDAVAEGDGLAAVELLVGGLRDIRRVERGGDVAGGEGLEQLAERLDVIAVGVRGDNRAHLRADVFHQVAEVVGVRGGVDEKGIVRLARVHHQVDIVFHRANRGLINGDVAVVDAFHATGRWRIAIGTDSDVVHAPQGNDDVQSMLGMRLMCENAIAP